MNLVRTNLVIWLSLLVIAIGLMTVFATKTHASVQCWGNPSYPTTVSATPGPQKGQVTLKWNLSTNVDRYDVVFGYKAGWTQKDYIFGGRRIGNENSSWYTVDGLGSGVKYFFRLSTRCGGSGGPASLSPEVSAIAK